MHALFELMPEEFNDPYNNAAAINESEARFKQKFGIPWVIGVVDGSHIPICRKYRGDNDRYYNRKGFMSIILSAIVDADGRFVSIDVGEKGARHDSYVYLTSELGIYMQQPNVLDDIDEPRFLLGDSAYSLDIRMMKAYDKRSTVPNETRPHLRRIQSKIGGTVFEYTFIMHLFAHLLILYNLLMCMCVYASCGFVCMCMCVCIVCVCMHVYVCVS